MTGGASEAAGEDGEELGDSRPTSSPFGGQLPVASEQASRSERVELPGEMATGIAHAFNSMLTIVLGSSLEQLHRQPVNERGQRQFARAEWGARQAERLARQILSLAGRHIRQQQLADLNTAIADFDKIIAHPSGTAPA